MGHITHNHFIDIVCEPSVFMSERLDVIQSGDPAALMLKRLSKIENGEVQSEELEADLYAASIVGKYNVIEMLYTIKNAADDVDPSSLVSKELALRIKTLEDVYVVPSGNIPKLVAA